MRMTSRWIAGGGDGLVKAPRSAVDLGIEAVDLGSQMCEAAVERAKKIQDIVQLAIPAAPDFSFW